MADTIVMIHGMWCTGEVWGNYRTVFEDKGYAVMTPTLRHHDATSGAAPDPALGTTSLLDYAADLEKDIRELDAPPVIMGHSMGGLLAQILCGRGLGKAGVFLTPAAPAGVMALTPSVVKTFARVLTTWGFWRKPTFPTFAEATYAVYNCLGGEEQRAEYAKLVHESGRAAAEIAFWLVDGRTAARVGALTCPALTVGAAHDRITPVSVVRKVACRYGDYKEFPDNAHWVLGEPGWQDVASYCREWLEKQTAGAAASGEAA